MLDRLSLMAASPVISIDEGKFPALQSSILMSSIEDIELEDESLTVT